MKVEELKQKCTERAKIFQQAMESCKSSNPIDCIEWFADRIAELEAQIEKMKCCENCQHWEGREPIPSLAEEGYYCFNDYPFECKRWELAEELKEIKEKWIKN